MKYRNLTSRLVGVFCLLATVLFVVGWQGISHLRQLNATMQNTIDNQWTEVRLTHQAYHLSEVNSRITLLIFLMDDPDEIKKLLEERVANTKRISEVMLNLEPHLNPDEERLFASVKATRIPYVESYQQALLLKFDEHKSDEARQMMVNVVRPNLIAYHNAWDVFDQHECAEIDQVIRQSKTDFISGQQKFLLTLLLAGLMTGTIAFFTVLRVDREITVRQLAEQSLQQAHDQLEQRVLERTAELVSSSERLRLLNSAVLQSKEAILITDAKLDLPGPTIIFINPAFTQMTGYTQEEAIGKTPRILQGPLTDKAVLGRLRKKLERGEMFAGEAINYRKDGAPFDLEWQIAPLRDAEEKITHFVAIQRDITERKRATEELHESEQRYRNLVESLPAAVYTCDAEGRVTLYNEAAVALWGQRPEIGKDYWCGSWRIYTLEGSLLSPEECPMAIAVREGRSVRGVEIIIERPDGSRSYVLPHPDPIRDAFGTIIGAVNMLVDLTERKRMEAQLSQSQKMETVGKLTGGIAHEFNSILTAIIGQSEFLLDDLPSDSPSAQSAMEINHAADRAASLTRQLLAYGRKQTLQPKILDLNSVLASMEDSLRLLMGRETELCLAPAVGLKSVKVDAGQMEQVILNMAINASEAMPNGGKLTLETANVTLDQDDVRLFPEAKMGDYVMLAVMDTGMGMSPETRAHIFEPFFTTKGVGQGSGLGLSTSHGIIHQSGGHISVQSAPAQGATFKIYLPQVAPMTKPSPAALDSPDLPHGTESILLVESDPALREMVETLLSRLGYTVLTATTCGEALSHARRHGPGPVDLLFADFAMSDMGVHELSERIRALYPQVRFLFARASNEKTDSHPTGSEKGGTFLQKPFSPFALARKLREVLDQPTAAKAKTVRKV